MSVRDIIWTVIIVWLVYKLHETFSAFSKKKSQAQGFENNNSYNKPKTGEVRIDKDIKQKSHFKPEDGEYVDYEEIK